MGARFRLSRPESCPARSRLSLDGSEAADQSNEDKPEQDKHFRWELGQLCGDTSFPCEPRLRRSKK